jgi:hypothetical protein
MSKLGEDIKAGVKGIRGAGDVLRGEVLEATDKIFEKKGDPRDVQAQARDRAITEKGKADLRGMDNMFARREWERKGVPPPTDTAAHNETYEALSSSAPTYEQPAPQHAVGRSVNTGAAAPPLPDRPVPDETLRYDTRRPPPTDPLQREPAENMPPFGVSGHNPPAQGLAGGVPSQTTHQQRQYPPGPYLEGESVPGRDFPPQPRYA